MKKKAIVSLSLVLCLSLPTTACTGIDVRGTSSDALAAKYAQYPRRDLTSKEKSVISSQVQSVLRDPDSARFEWGRLIVRKELGFSIYCGQVNSRNGFGGYSGNGPFMVYIYNIKGVSSANVVSIGGSQYRDKLPTYKQCAANGYTFGQNLNFYF